MRTILPGEPQAALQAVTTGLWNGRQIIAYISGTALVILDGPARLLQTIYVGQDDSLLAVDFDEGLGKMAVCSTRSVVVYKPYGQDEGALKWAWQGDWSPEDASERLRTLSWGEEEELLVGGTTSVTILSTHGEPTPLWTDRLSSAAKFASFSHDASLVATTGTYDRLVKIWKRLIFGSDGISFDSDYLAHPAPVTHLHWRRPFHKEQHMDCVLYTVCVDKKLRIWAPMDPHGLQILQPWGQIDLVESIQPRSIALAERSQRRFAFVIDSRDFSVATERAVQQASGDEAEQHALHHLVEMATRNPEVVVVLDDRGNMSAWGLERVGCRVRQTSDIFNVAHVEGLRLHLPMASSGHADYVRFYNFCGGERAPFSLLVHHFDGRIEWFECRLDELFDPARKRARLVQRALWTGHSADIEKIVRTATGESLMSSTTGNESIVWRRKSADGGVGLTRHSTLTTRDRIHHSWLLQEGNIAVLLHYDCISVWNTSTAKAFEVARRPFSLAGKPLCLIGISETAAESGTVYVATVTSKLEGVAWEIRLPARGHGTPPTTPPSSNVTISEFGTFSLACGDDVSYFLPVDPAGPTPVISGFLDVCARDVAISYTRSGVLKSWTARVDTTARRMEWRDISTVETGILEPSLASGTSVGKAALVDADKTELTIWGTRSGQLEHRESFDGQGAIQDLTWCATPDYQSILAVGFPHRVVIFAQLRFDYLDVGPSWASVKEVSVRELTPHPIGDSVWLGGGNLVVGAGNQLFVQDDKIDVSDGLLPDVRATSGTKHELDLFTVVGRLNGHLPVYHPQFVAQCVLLGKMALAQRILLRLHEKLKFFTDGDELDGFLDMDAAEFISDDDEAPRSARKQMHAAYADDSADELDSHTVTEEVASKLNELLANICVPRLSSREQVNLVDMVECVGMLDRHRRSIDDNCCRFLFFFRQHATRAGRGAQQASISWREISWAYHSGSQDILADVVSRHFQGKMLWRHARACGMFMWMTDLAALRAQFENIARNEYAKSDDRNPVDCSLHYLALRKKTVLVGLWRMAAGHREQRGTAKLLANDFTEPRWRSAAVKNAYALLGKRRFEYAAAFFLLGDKLADAVAVIEKQLGDVQLAVAVARVYEGDDGPVLGALLLRKVLPAAVAQGDRWLAAWALWMLGRRDAAVAALVAPLEDVASAAAAAAVGPEPRRLEARSWMRDDAALVVLYRQLRGAGRGRSGQTGMGTLAVGGRAEWEVVMSTARLYGRMGCGMLGLGLVRKWEFLDGSVGVGMGVGMGDGVVNGSGYGMIGHGKKEEEEEREEKEETKEKRVPTQFKEPESSSLLDSFGF